MGKSLCMKHLALLLMGITSISVFAQMPNYWQTETYSSTAGQLLNAVESDAHGNTYHLLNVEDSVDLDPSPYREHWVYASSGNRECFFFKLDVNRNLLWHKRLYGTQDLNGLLLAYDGKSHIYAIGTFRGTGQFNNGNPNGVIHSQGSADLFIGRYDTAGTRDWTRAIQSPDQLDPMAAGCDRDGRVYLSGFFAATTNFEPSTTNHIYNISPNEIEEAFIVAYDTTSSLHKVNVMRQGWDVIYDMDFSPNGDIFVCGASYGSTDLDFGSGTDIHSSASPGIPDMYIMSMDENWNQKHLYYFSRGTTDHISITSLEYNHSSGLILAAGGFQSTRDFDLSSTGTTSLTAGTQGSGYFIAIDTAFQFQWVKGLIGAGNSHATIAVDSTGMIWLHASGNGSFDMDPGPGTVNIVPTSGQMIIGRYTSAGQYIWHGMTSAGAGFFDYEVTDNGSFYTAGFYYSTTDFNPTLAVDSKTPDLWDGFHMMLTDCTIINHVDVVDVCDSLIWSNGITYSETGMYKFSKTTVNQCDSSIWLDLTIRRVEDSVYTVGDTMIVVDAPGATVLWRTCSSGDLMPDSGSVFSPTFNGSFQAIIFQNGCVDTTDCITISSIGIEESNLNSSQIFPNPSTGVIDIVPSPIAGSLHIRVLGLNGSTLDYLEKENTQPFRHTLDLPRGVYIVELRYENDELERKRIVIQ